MHLLKRARILLEDLSTTQIQQLTFSQLPNGRTLLHQLKHNPESIEQIFSAVNDRQQTFYVPILEDKN